MINIMDGGEEYTKQRRFIMGAHAGADVFTHAEMEREELDLDFDGSKIAVFSKDEIKFVIANKRFAMGKSIMSDSEYDALRVKLFAVYKQATIGDCHEPKPFDARQREKWAEWCKFVGTPKLVAQRRYITLLRTFDLRECGHPDCGVSALQFSRKGHELFVGTDAGGLLVVTDPRLGLLQLDASLHQTFVGL